MQVTGARSLSVATRGCSQPNNWRYYADAYIDTSYRVVLACCEPVGATSLKLKCRRPERELNPPSESGQIHRRSDGLPVRV
jgi:hypothetical protein